MFTRNCLPGIFILLFCISPRVYTQTVSQHYTISYLTSKDGLSQGSNLYMKEDREGYMWISSYDGINVYNGKSINLFNEQRFYRDCEPLKYVIGIEEDRDGNMWIGSSKGLYRYDRAKNIFTHFNIFSPQAPGETGEVVMPFAVAGDEVWLFNGYNSFKTINIKTNAVRFIQEVPVAYSAGIITPQFDKDGNIWCVNNAGLVKLDTGGRKNITYYYSPLAGNRFGKPALITSFAISERDQVICLSTDRGVVLFDTRNTREPAFINPYEQASNPLQRFVIADGDRFLVSSTSCALYAIDPAKPGIEMLLQNEPVHTNSFFNDYGTRNLYRDRWNRIWMNKDGEFVAIIDFTEPFFKKCIAGNKPADLSVGTVICIAALPGGEIWIVEGNNISVVDRVSGKVKRRITAADLPGTAKDQIYSVYYDKILNRVWIGAGEYIFYYSVSTGIFRKLDIIMPQTGTQKNYLASNFTRLGNGRLLMGTLRGIYEIDANANTAYPLPLLEQKAIYYLTPLPGNRFAISIPEQPMQIFRWLPGGAPELLKSLDQVNNFAMFAAGDSIHGTTWVGTRKGVYKLDKDYRIIKHFTVESGLLNDYCYSLILDGQQNPWFSTNKGIISIDAESNKIHNYPGGYNLQDPEFNNRTFTKDDSGYIYMGGVKGMNYFKPPYTENDSIKPVLMLEEVQLNNKPFFTAENPAYIETVNYAYGAYSLSFKVSALHLKSGANLKIVYRLGGDDKEWNTINNGEFIQFYNLPPGNYVLELGYVNMQGALVPAKNITIHVAAPWYRTWWFYSLCVLVIAVLLYLAYRYRVRQLEKTIALRTRISKDLHDDVGASLSSIHIYSSVAEKMMETDPGKAKEVMQQINENTRQVMDNMNDIVWSLNKDDSEEKSFTSRVKNFGYELLAAKQINCEYHIDEKAMGRISSPEVRRNLLLIIKEALNNSSKYSGADLVEIKLGMTGNELELLISDNGKGFNRDEIKEGNGLANIKKRTEILKGSCSIESRVGEGTKIVCSFPNTIFSDK